MLPIRRRLRNRRLHLLCQPVHLPSAPRSYFDEVQHERPRPLQQNLCKALVEGEGMDSRLSVSSTH